MNDLLIYIPAGYPDMGTTKRILVALNSLPITGVEIGIPFSDPIADGPVIQKAYTESLKNRTNLKKILIMINGLKLSYDIYLMGYLNSIINYPEDFKKLREARIKGFIIPDLPVKEVKSINLKLPLILFTAPNTNDEEIRMINKLSPPFVYYVARYGVTGVQKSLPYLTHIREIKKKIQAPLYVGFGLSTNEQIKKVWQFADGAIVGSAIVKIIENSNKKYIVKNVVKKVKSLLAIE